MVRAGTLKEKFIFEEPTWTKASSGAETATYTVFAIRHGSIKQESGVEQIESGQATAQRTYLVGIRYLQGLEETFRIKWGDIYLSIVSIDNIENKNREMILRCKRYVN